MKTKTIRAVWVVGDDFRVRVQGPVDGESFTLYFPDQDNFEVRIPVEFAQNLYEALGEVL